MMKDWMVVFCKGFTKIGEEEISYKTTPARDSSFFPPVFGFGG
jgi:hypothetical protein